MSCLLVENQLIISNLISSSSQPSLDQFFDIVDADYEAVINLIAPSSPHYLNQEAERVISLEMSYFHIPVPFDSPQPYHLKQFFGLMNLMQDNKVWVHCALNYRASAFLYQYYRLILNKSVQEAKQVMLPQWQPDRIWQQFMKLEMDDLSH
jgi:protein tyrosine phosphatase (PTP) superfamily phosphohydrolase (DUF442 family)